MANITNVNYDAQITKIEAMADGAKKHSANPKIANNINEASYRALKIELEKSRQDYVDKEVQARKAYDAFNALFIKVQATSAADARILKGVLGRKEESLKDFGIAPDKDNGTRKAKPKV